MASSVSLQVYKHISWSTSALSDSDSLWVLVGRGRQVWGRFCVDVGSDEEHSQLLHVRNSLVAGFDVLGVVCAGDANVSDADLDVLKDDVSDDQLLLCGKLVDDADGDDDVWSGAEWTDLVSGNPVQMQEVDYVDLECLAADSLLVELHLQQDVLVTLENTTKIKRAAFTDAVMNAFDQLRAHWLRSEHHCLHVQLGASMYPIQGTAASQDSSSDSDDATGTLSFFYHEAEQSESADGKKRTQTKSTTFMQHALKAKCFERISGEELSEKLFKCAPIIQTERRSVRSVCIPLHLSLCCVCDGTSDIATLCSLIHTSIQRSLALCQQHVVNNTNLQTGDIRVPNVVPFQPLPSTPYLCQFALPHAVDQEQERQKLEQLHGTFALPLDRPCLRAGNQFRVQHDYLDGYLRNVHTHVKQTAARGAVHLVSGTYTYHHYVQDGVDDNGWGCAYRSLQTICSWFRYQGYTDKPVPTHQDIQQALVDIGDRDHKFVGSRQWIGSLEVSYVLDHLLGVEAQIVTAQTGADMPDTARQLAVHFDTHGTPVMIGGGVLAHTILGVDFNEDTGDVQWLILDPHYNEPTDDIKTIIKNGWCGWKQPSFWRNDTFYNMCLPRRPKQI